MSLVWAIIEAPSRGWGSPLIIGAFIVAAIVLGAFGWWETHSTHPMLDVRFFRNPRFSAASAGITLLFFAMFGMLFVLTLYLQDVMGYSAFQAGVRFLPFAAGMLVVAPLSARLVERTGTKVIVASGLAISALALAFFATLPVHASYPRDVLWRMLLLAVGMGLTMAPATESIMGSLPRAKAGVGSAMNDTTRQVGGALGVAIVGSAMASVYRSHIDTLLAAHPLPAPAAVATRSSLAGALQVAQKLPPPLRGELTLVAKHAFVEGMHSGIIAAVVAAGVGSLVALKWLPARGASPDEVVDEVHNDEIRADGSVPVALAEA
jgi:predicted MFS family arabinose efflux permease